MRSAPQSLELPVQSALDGEDAGRLDWSGDVRGLEFSEQTGGLSQSRPMLPALRWVSLLAFGQAIAFLAFWLFICASAGAAPAKPAQPFTLDLQLSAYEPTKARDPMTKVGAVSPEAKLLPGAAIPFVLEGILYQASNPSAVVNGKLLTLDKTVSLSIGTSEVQVRAIEIGRDKVVLEASGQKVELRLNLAGHPTP
jgi:hypothetical protein